VYAYAVKKQADIRFCKLKNVDFEFAKAYTTDTICVCCNAYKHVHCYLPTPPWSAVLAAIKDMPTSCMLLHHTALASNTACPDAIAASLRKHG
jgi:hypothetical protein